MAASTETGDDDPFSRLTDDLLRHVLSFLPDDDALQTCVLDTRWRDLWKTTTSLYFDFYDTEYRKKLARSRLEDPCPVMEKLARFEQGVNLIMQLRGTSPLAKCKIGSFLDEGDADRLVEYALMCQVKELIVSEGSDAAPLIYCAPFISQHLMIMEFHCVDFIDSSLDFSNCPVLEDLKIYRCDIEAPNISSKSLKHLRITLCRLSLKFHIRIVAPGLVSLQLDDFYGLTPSLGYMPFLVTAYVGLGSQGFPGDFCEMDRQGCERPDCDFHAYPVDECVLLNGLSNAASLELTAISKRFIYIWDLKWCPIFDKLKSLLLNEWFTAIDLGCILQHTPILEILTLRIGNTEKLIGATAAQETIEQSSVSTHLKVVNIECEEVDEVVHKILKILRTCGVLRDHISIKAPSSPSYPSYRFSFQKPPHTVRCGPSCSSCHH